MSGLAVRAESVVRSFRGRGGTRVRAVDGVTLDVAPGEWVALTGPSGCGKTTLLALLAALDRPTGGSIRHDGVDVGSASEGELVRRRRLVGVVFQHAPMVPRLPVWENVTAALIPLGAGSRERRALALGALEPVGMASLAERRPEELSGGERQRVAVARALVTSPGLVVADEPTSQLDPVSAAHVLDALRGAHRCGATVLIATHDAAALEGAGRIVRMTSGRIASPV